MLLLISNNVLLTLVIIMKPGNFCERKWLRDYYKYFKK